MLDLFFRKYAWTANLALLFVAAWLSAKTVNTLVGAVIRPRPQADTTVATAPPPRSPPPAPLDDAKLYHLIGQDPPPRADEEAEHRPPPRPQNCMDAAAAPVHSDLRLQLVAGVLAERPQSSLATLVDVTSRQTLVVGWGEQIGGATFMGIERIRDENDVTGNGFRMVALICNGGTKEYVDESAGSGEALASAGNVGSFPVPPPGGPPPGGAMAGIRPTGNNQYVLEAQVVDSALGNLNALATQARIVPSFKNGVANGFKLFSIQPGSLYASIGIENGDVIQRINGYEINSPEKALELYQKLRESGHVTIELERQGQVIRKDYTITGR
jgi:general secretion pathway protein C